MAILPMKRILICGLKKDRKEVLEFLPIDQVQECRRHLNHQFLLSYFIKFN